MDIRRRDQETIEEETRQSASVWALLKCHGTTRGNPEEPQRSVPIREESRGGTSGVSKGVPEGIPQGRASRCLEEVPQESPKGRARRASKGVPGGIPQGAKTDR